MLDTTQSLYLHAHKQFHEKKSCCFFVAMRNPWTLQNSTISHLFTGNWQVLILPFNAAELSKVLKNEEALKWTWWEATFSEKDESASFSLQARVCSLSSSPLREWSCCLSAARKKTPPLPLSRGPRGGWGGSCVYTPLWTGKLRGGRSVSAAMGLLHGSVGDGCFGELAELQLCLGWIMNSRCSCG